MNIFLIFSLVIIMLAVVSYLLRHTHNRKIQPSSKFTGKSRRRAWMIGDNTKLSDLPWVYNNEYAFYDYDSTIWIQGIDLKWYDQDTEIEYSPDAEIFENDDNFYDYDPTTEIPKNLNNVVDFEIVMAPTRKPNKN